MKNQYVTTAKAGEPITVLMEVITREACDDNTSGRWYCVTHHTDLYDNFTKAVHLRTGAHFMAWRCYIHDAWEDPGPQL